MKNVPQHVVNVNRKIYNKFMKEVKKAKPVIHSTTDKTARKKMEIEFSYIVNEAKGYGFNFFPDVFVSPCIDRLKDIRSNYK